ncbi:glycosyl hydrolase family 61-domain-containing protein [Plectosphaerella plurivora]|uniref:lytic cellulose monooxygenase (C4-dehydrogenating) n=1 Tax=Plectosphaerella plurivora TaxID=936078 RepID=A0A9P9A6U0_9PEZI|nr:glycosyl hydrolase family 61-domain-containing protein [Plectosphaerella plurivora]
MRTAAASLMAMATMATSVSAHAWMHGVWVNGVDQGDGRKEYIRTPENNSPVKDLASPNLACNVNGGKAVPSFVSAAAGDKLSFEWFHDNRNDDIIDKSHKGPVITYIAPYTTGDGTGAIWTKIAEDGYDGTSWAVDKLIANKGLADFTLPESLAAGQYLIRQEIIAHHESDASFAANPARGAQFYPSCVQVEVTGGGSAVPDQAFDFNTGYTYADPGIVGVNLYAPITSYKIPGPEVWTGSGSGSAPAPKPTTSAAAPAAPTTSAAAAPVATTPAAGAPSPVFSSVPSAPTTTLATVIAPAPTASSAAPAAPSATAPATPPSTCRRRRSLKAKRAKLAAAKRSAEKVRRVGRAQF